MQESGSDGGSAQDGARPGRTEGAAAHRRTRRLLWAVVAVAAAAVVGIAVARRAPAPAATTPADAAATQAAAAIGGPFHLVDQDGRAVDQSILKGKWSLVFFGYTSCPDVCPTTLQALAAAQDRLGADAATTQVVFISVDPDRDHPAEMKAYLSQPGFPKAAVGLTGTPEQVAGAARAYHAFYRKRPRADGGYDMDHGAFIYLMDPSGRFRLPALSEQEGPDALAQAVRVAMRQG